MSARNGARAGAGKASEIASYNETLAILTVRAREGDVRAAIALAGHLRPAPDKRSDVQREIDELIEAATRNAH